MKSRDSELLASLVEWWERRNSETIETKAQKNQTNVS